MMILLFFLDHQNPCVAVELMTAYANSHGNSGKSLPPFSRSISNATSEQNEKFFVY